MLINTTHQLKFIPNLIVGIFLFYRLITISSPSTYTFSNLCYGIILPFIFISNGSRLASPFYDFGNLENSKAAKNYETHYYNWYQNIK